MGAIITTPLAVTSADKFPVTPVANGIVPDEALAITCNLQFSPSVQAILIDLSESARKFNTVPIQGAFIDTSGSTIDLRIDNSVTGQSILAKAGLQGYYNLLCPMPAKLIAVLASTPGAQLNITMILYNTVIESEVWGLTTGPAGATGPQGPPGATGATGPQGPAGPAGAIAQVQNQGTLVTPVQSTLNFTGTGVTATNDGVNNRTNITIPGAPVSSVFTRTGAVVAQTGDYTAAMVTNAVDSTGSYSNPPWLTTLAWGKITGAPSVSSYQTPWLTNINAANNNLLGAGLIQSAQLQLMGTSTTPAQQSYYFNSLLRWTWTQVNTETGSNVGSDLTLVDYNDAGASLGTVLFLKRSTSNVGLGTANPLYRLDVRTPGAIATQLHIASTDTDAGGYLTSTTDNALHMSAGAAYSGTAWTAKATAATLVQLLASGNIQFSSDTGLTVGNTYTPTPRVFITSVGNVGIGTANSLYRLDVRTPGSTINQLHVASTDTDTGCYLGSYSATNFVLGNFTYDGTTSTAKSSSAIGLFLNTSGLQLSINNSTTVGSAFSPTTIFSVNSLGPGACVGIGVAVPTNALQLAVDNAVKPTTNTWTIASGAKVKKHVKRLKGGLDIINKLSPTEAEYNGKGGTPEGQRVVSLIAEEVREILPHTVTEDVDGNLGFNVHEVIHHLILAVQQLSRKLEKMEAVA